MLDNVRIFLVNILDKIVPSKAVIYGESVNNTGLYFRLTVNGNSYPIPKSAVIKIKIGNDYIDDKYVTIGNRFQGQFSVALDASMFNLGANRQYDLTIELYNIDDPTKTESCYTLFNQTVVTLMYSTGVDDLAQVSTEAVFNSTGNEANYNIFSFYN